jgi:hypothetical protein
MGGLRNALVDDENIGIKNAGIRRRFQDVKNSDR